MQCKTMGYNRIQCNAIHWDTIQYNAMQYNAMQCNGIQCASSWLQSNLVQFNAFADCNTNEIAIKCNCNTYVCYMQHLLIAKHDAMQSNAIYKQL